MNANRRSARSSASTRVTGRPVAPGRLRNLGLLRALGLLPLLGLLLVLGSPLPTSAAVQETRQADPEVLLEKARYEESVRGDLHAAIAIYRRVAEEHGERREVAARALLHLGEAYEVLGREGARDAYRRILAEYGDQVRAADTARKRLAALGPATPAASEVAARPSEPTGFTMRRLWSTPVGLTVRSLSPDGRRVAFVDWGGLDDPALRGEADVAIYDLETERFHRVTDLPPQSVVETYPTAPVWSRDGRRLVYSHWDDDWTHQRLHLVRPDGSENRVLVDNEQFAGLEAMAYSASGEFVVVRIRGWDEAYRIALVSTDDGEVTILKTGGTHPPHPLSLSPDDRFIVFDQHQEGSDERHDIFALAVDGSGEFRLAESPADDHLPHWTPDGEHVVFLSDRSGRPALWAVPVRDGRAAGPPRLAREGVGEMYPLGFTAAGGLYYRLPLWRTDVFAAELDLGAGRAAEPRLLTRDFVGTNMRPVWGPDGERLAYVSRRGPAGDEYHLVVRDPTAEEERAHLLPFATPDIFEMDWSEDGRAVYLESGSRGEWTSYRVDVATGEVTEVERRQPAGYAGGYTYAMTTERQARYLRSAGIRVAGQNDGVHYREGDWAVGPDETLYSIREGVWRFPDGPAGEPEALRPAGHAHTWRLSPDGRTLAIALSSDPEVVVSDVLYVVALPDGELRELVRTEGGELRKRLPEDPALDETYEEREILAVHWTPDGERLVYAVGEERSEAPVEFWMIAVEGGEPVRLEMDLTVRQFAGLSFRPDGGAVAFTDEERLRELWLMEGLEW